MTANSNTTLEAAGLLVSNNSTFAYGGGGVNIFTGLIKPTGTVNMIAYGTQVNSGTIDFSNSSSGLNSTGLVVADSQWTDGDGVYETYGLHVTNLQEGQSVKVNAATISAARGTVNLSESNVTGAAIYVGTGGEVTVLGATKLNQNLTFSLTNAGYAFSTGAEDTGDTKVVPLGAIEVTGGGVLNIGEESTAATITYNGDILVDGGSLVFSDGAQSSLTPGSIGGNAVTNNLIFQNGATLSQGTGENAGSITAQNIEVYGSGTEEEPFEFTGETTAKGALIVGGGTGDQAGDSYVNVSGQFTISNQAPEGYPETEDDYIPSSVAVGSQLNIASNATFENGEDSWINVAGILAVADNTTGETEGRKFENKGTINITEAGSATFSPDFSQDNTQKNVLGSIVSAGTTTFDNSAGFTLDGTNNNLQVTGGTTTVSGPITVTGSEEESALNVTGGTLNMGSEESGVELNNQGGNISVGTPGGTINAYGGFKDNASAKTSVLSGGTFNVPSELTVAGTVNVAGGTLNADESLTVSSGANFNVSGENGNATVGGLFTNSGTTTIGQGTEAPNNQSGGTVYANGGFLSNGTATNVNQGGKLVVSGGEGDNAGLNIGGGTFGINGGTVEVSGPFNMTGGNATVGGSGAAASVLDLTNVTDFSMGSGSNLRKRCTIPNFRAGTCINITR